MKLQMNNSTAQTSSELEHAFLMFNKLSERLTGSYQELEVKVAQLTRELSHAHDERLAELAQKKVLAEQLELLLDTLPAAVLVIDRDGYITQANPVAHQMLGAELTGASWMRISRNAFIRAGDEFQLSDGRWVTVAITPLEAESGKLVMITDISESRSLQKIISRQQRLSSLGEMVASIAHQLRTPLASALLYISTLSHPFTKENDRKNMADKAKDRLRHLERMVNDMLVFARGEVSSDENIDVVLILERLIASISEQDATRDIEFSIDKHTDKAYVRANSDALYSMLQNILDNAIQACAAKRDYTTQQLAIQVVLSVNADAQVEIEFIDNGIGMSEETIERAIEPFYTTRSKGTGLGVSVVDASLQSLGGQLLIESVQGLGSSVCLLIPRAEFIEMMPSEISNSALVSSY